MAAAPSASGGAIVVAAAASAQPSGATSATASTASTASTTTTVDHIDDDDDDGGFPAKNTADGTTANQEISYLVEIAKATLPGRSGRWGMRDDGAGAARGMHCTAYWNGPTNPSGRRRMERLLHRTKTLKIKGSGASSDDGDAISDDATTLASSSSSADDDVDLVPGTTEHIFTVDHRMLFLFRTTVKQLANASSGSGLDLTLSQTSSVDGGIGGRFDGGGLRFDVFEKPSNVLNSVYSTVLADNVAEKERNAIARESSSSLTSYRLMGSAFLSPEEILSRCDGQRFECSLMDNLRKMMQQQDRTSGSFRRTTPHKVDGGRLALRIRPASEYDVSFMKSLEDRTAHSSALRSALVRSPSSRRLKATTLTTEVDENLLAAETSMKAMGNISPVARESMRYLFSNDTEKRVMVKPHPDPTRPAETTWFTEEGLREECMLPSTRWTLAGEDEGDGDGNGCGNYNARSLGRVYLEVLECRGLPNTDAGGTIGNKTDAFVSVVYGDAMVQTEVIDDSLSPMWMPWTTRAFVFQITHPSTDIYIGVADYDVGPLEHECIGRTTIHLNNFSPGTLYTLTYGLYESSNLIEKGDDMGTITVRLRIEIPDERRYLMEGWKPVTRNWVNSLQWKTHRVAKYCVDGPHDEEVFEMRLFRSHINELLATKRHLTYAISDAMRSLVYWRGQVRVGNVWLPLHSAIVYYFGIHAIERPHLLPSFVLLGAGWIMIANMLHRASHPNPWHRGYSFAQHWNVLTRGDAYRATERNIRPMQGHKEASKLESKWKQRLADDDEQYAKQAELDAKIKTISDDTVIRTKAKANSALDDPISALAGAKLLPYQQRLSRYCNKVRYIRNVMNWNESIIAFFVTLTLFGAGFVALFIPWRFLLLWTSRLLVWVGLGPWMRILDLFFHEETERQKASVSSKAMNLFREQRKKAKILREHAIKMKAFRVKLFGQYITRLPDFNLTRWEDRPLPESFAEPYNSDEDVRVVKFVNSQDLSGTMIPMTGQDAVESEARKQKEKDRLVSKYQSMVNEKSELGSVPEENSDRTNVVQRQPHGPGMDRVTSAHQRPSGGLASELG